MSVYINAFVCVLVKLYFTEPKGISERSFEESRNRRPVVVVMVGCARTIECISFHVGKN